MEPVQDLVGYPVSDQATEAVIIFKEDGTADITVHETSGRVLFYPSVKVSNPTNIPREERRPIRAS
jgi:hypothetical protein